jgi:ACS family tartrate transporter-like MFS transporter
MLILGWNSDRTGERNMHASIPRIVAGFAMAGVVLAGNNVAVALTLLSIATAGILGAYGPIWTIPSTFLSKSEVAASNGLITSLGNLGGFIGPFFVGYFSNRTGSYSAGLLGMGALVAGCSLLVIPLGKWRGSKS